MSLQTNKQTKRHHQNPQKRVKGPEHQSCLCVRTTDSCWDSRMFSECRERQRATARIPAHPDNTVLGDWTLEDRASLQGTVVQLPWGLPRAGYLSQLSLVPYCCVTPRLPPWKNLLHLRLHQDVLAEPTWDLCQSLRFRDPNLRNSSLVSGHLHQSGWTSA